MIALKGRYDGITITFDKLYYNARSLKFVEKAPSDFLLQLLDITRRIFT